jgi:hypothetical protein
LGTEALAKVAQRVGSVLIPRSSRPELRLIFAMKPYGCSPLLAVVFILIYIRQKYLQNSVFLWDQAKHKAQAPF